jgi:hypothetical protein
MSRLAPTTSVSPPCFSIWDLKGEPIAAEVLCRRRAGWAICRPNAKFVHLLRIEEEVLAQPGRSVDEGAADVTRSVKLIVVILTPAAALHAKPPRNGCDLASWDGKVSSTGRISNSFLEIHRKLPGVRTRLLRGQSIGKPRRVMARLGVGFDGHPMPTVFGKDSPCRTSHALVARIDRGRGLRWAAHKTHSGRLLVAPRQPGGDRRQRVHAAARAPRSPNYYTTPRSTNGHRPAGSPESGVRTPFIIPTGTPHSREREGRNLSLSRLSTRRSSSTAADDPCAARFLHV